MTIVQRESLQTMIDFETYPEPKPPSAPLTTRMLREAIRPAMQATKAKPTLLTTENRSKTVPSLPPASIRGFGFKAQRPPAPDTSPAAATFPFDSEHSDNDEAPIKTPKLTKSFNAQYFNRSELPKAYELARQQKFGKDNINQSYTTEPGFDHILFQIYKSKFLQKKELKNVWRASPKTKKLWNEWKRVKHLDFRPLREPNLQWTTQTTIDDTRVDLRLALLFHYDLDLAAVQRFIGGNHVGAQRDPDVILPRVKDLIPPDVYDDLERILRFGCPAKINAEGTNEQFRQQLRYKNHKSFTSNPEKVKKAMVKEDKRDNVLTLPSWIADFIPHLMLTANGLVIIVGKNDRFVFDASHMITLDSVPFNHLVDNINEPDIVFGDAWERFLQYVYNLRITYPTRDILLMADDVTAAFRGPKYNPNVISAKAFFALRYLLIPTGLTFGDTTSPPNFEPFARARIALAKELSKGNEPIPAYDDYLTAVRFAPKAPPNTVFARARKDSLNPGVLDASGNPLPCEFNMHVDDNLYAAASEADMRWAMRCSIHALNEIWGHPEPHLRPNACDFDKFVSEDVGHVRKTLGYTTNTRTMTVTIPEDKRQAMIDELRTTWGPQRRSFTLLEAAKLLGTLVSLCRICPWGIFLFTNLHHAMTDIMRSNSKRLWNSPEYRDLIKNRDLTRGHPTESSRFKWFSSKTAKAIWDCKAQTWITVQVRAELDFIATVFSNPMIYLWESPIAHLIPLEPDYAGWQDSCLSGAGGFSFQLFFWWVVEWPSFIQQRSIRFLKKGDTNLISINLLEYAAIIVGLAASIVAWEKMPQHSRPQHPMLLLWTDNTTAESWTRRISGLKGPQGKGLARLFAHLLMFSDVGVRAAYVEGEQNVIADHLSRIRHTDDFSQFTYPALEQKFPRLATCRRFQPSPELISALFTTLSTGFTTLPETRMPLGRM